MLRYNYGDKLCREGETKKYIINRISGIYPIYLFMMAVALITGYGIAPSRRQTLLVLPFNLALLQTFDHEKFYGLFYNNNCWYIATAFVLYMLFPVLNRILNSLKLNKLKWLGLAFLFCVGCSEYLYLLNIHAPISNTFLSYYAHPLYRIPEFVSGMLLCDIHQITAKKWKVGTVRTLLLGGTVGAVGGLLLLCRFFGGYYNLYNIVFIPVFGLVLLGVTLLSETSVLYRFAGSGPIQYASNLTFLIYLCQSFSIQTINYLINSGVTVGAAVWQAVYILLTLVLAVLLHHIIEVPGKKLFRKLLNRFFAGKQENAHG